MIKDEALTCSTHPDAPHGFLRNASHEADQYICECAYWKPPREWVGLTEDDVNNSLYKYHGWREFAAELERLLKEKNYG